ncbi:phosphoribosyltransferase family protein [Hymenobacter sp. BT770]|uniref:ComF family protein n=1 Tax=Hymenobacter sp. BT770 TaxID=2886942 RepID=UPI001D112BA8|nr:phosphoribosyltransferase family protein [Hymenobacter sp. BT770]MCC3153460.1 ComF family protein [Hymenobacter sp. BT770]MDO3415458.1 phosphoribosyltransferase family protein [Hymenobacter sp. BT770]
MLHSFWGDFVGLIFPRLCLACREPLVSGENHLCTGCRAELPYTDFHLLPPEQNPIGRRFWGKLPVRHALSYLRFVRHGRVQSLLHELKYQGQRDVGTALGQLYGAELHDAGLAADFDLIVPVPLHPRKLAKRGYNQAAAFASGLSEGLQLPWSATALRRTTHTSTQTRKNRAERWENVATVFEVESPLAIVGQRVLVVDDVLTTGATLEACGAALLAAGAADVSVATIAYADR